MKRLILLCSNVAVASIADYIIKTFQQDVEMPGLSIAWQGTTTRHALGLIIIEGEAIPERLLDMIYTARDLFDFTEVFEGMPSPAASDPATSTPDVHEQ